MVRRTSVLEKKRSRNRVRSTRPSSRKARYSWLRRLWVPELGQQHQWHDAPGLDGQHDLDHVPFVSFL